MTDSRPRVTNPTPGRGPLPFSIGGGGDTGHYGAYYWSIGLSDGREAFVMADRVEVTITGGLVCWWDTRKSPNPAGGPMEPRDAPQSTLGFAAGQWTCFYAASVIDGDPVAIDSLAAPR